MLSNAVWRFPLLLSILVFISSASAQSENNSNKPKFSFRIHGSNTVGEKFAPDLIKDFLRHKGYMLTQIQARNSELAAPELERMITASNSASNIEIELFSHGSSTGFKDLLSEKADIAMSSRQIKQKEKQALKSLYPSITSDVTEHVIAFDALAIILHPDNPIEQLTIAQLAQIYSGEVSNWKVLGGLDQPISVNARDNNSGTYDTFKSLVLKPNEVTLAEFARRFESSAELTQVVTNDIAAVGFVGVSHTAASKVVAISESESSVAVIPDEHTIGTEDYPLSRKLFLYLPIEINNGLATEFVDFSQSTKGQRLAKRSNLVSYFPIKSKPKLANVKLSGQFNNLRTFGERLSISFKFENDFIDAKNKRDLKRLQNFQTQNPKQRIVLAGFEPNLQTEKSEIENWIQLLRSQISETSLSAWEVHVGPHSFIGDATQIQQSMDRRIEVWVL